MVAFRANARRMKNFVCSMLFVVVVVATLPAVVWGQSSEFDDWRGFEDGSWSEVRTVSETLDEQGTVVSTSTSSARLTLARSTDGEVTLEVGEGTVEYAGKTFPTPAAKLVLRPYGETDGEKVTIVDTSEAGLNNLDGRNLKAVIAGGDGTREVTSVFRNASTALPARRIVKTFDSQGESISTTTTDEFAANVPYPVGGGIRPTTYYGTLYRNHKLSSTAVVAKSSDVPGHLVHATTVERDASGRIFRRTSQELVDYQATPKTRGATIGERIQDRRERRDERRGRR